MKQKKSPQHILSHLLLMLGGVGLSGILIMALLAIFPQLRPDTMVFTVGMGDIFYHHPEWVLRPENPDEILSVHRLVYDEEGFRVPAKPAAEYDVLALGDSYTEAANVASPWADVLAEASGLSVRNLGHRGYGPVETTYIINRYGQNTSSDILIYGYFEGNDLNNVEASQGQEVVLPSEADYPDHVAIDFDEIDQSGVRYPMTVQMGSATYPIAFFEWYIWNLNVTPEALDSSVQMALLRTEFERMRAASGDACLVIAYFPSKPHIYLPYLDEASQQVLLANSHERALDQNMALQTIPHPDLTFEQFINRLDNQRDLVRSAAESLGIHFFDTTPILRQAAAQGNMLYYTYDTHWNQQGHTLVGQALADYLATGICDE